VGVGLAESRLQAAADGAAILLMIAATVLHIVEQAFV